MSESLNGTNGKYAPDAEPAALKQIDLMVALVEYALTLPGVNDAGIETFRDRKTFWIETHEDPPLSFVHRFTASIED